MCYRRSRFLIVLAGMLTATMLAPAWGQLTILPGGGEVNMSGATLFAPFYPTMAATNDFINADDDYTGCGRPMAGFYDSSCLDQGTAVVTLDDPPTTSTVTDSTKTWTVDEWVGDVCYIDGADYAILANTATALTVEGIPPTGTQPYGICDGIPDDVDQLAASFACTMTTFWAVNIRGVGSGNGLAEFRNYELCGGIPTSIPPEGGWFNRTLYAANGSVISLGCGGQGPSGTPFPQTSIDIGVMDVPTPWFVTLSGSPAWDTAPGSAGYGGNPTTSSATATLVGGQSNKLKSLCTDCTEDTGTGNVTLDPPPTPPDPQTSTVTDVTKAWVVDEWVGDRCVISTGEYEISANTATALTVVGTPPAGAQAYEILREHCLNIDHTLPPPLPATTVYDTTVAWVPIAIISNRGTGIDTLKYSEMQYLWLTGRLPTGENLKANTRDSGSGTRNGSMNSICVDPSWGRGDNLGKKFDNKALTKLGPASQWTNCGGSSVMEEAVINHGLAVGYTGLMGNGRAAHDATSGKYEILSVVKDRGSPLCGAGTPVRPTLLATIDNADPCTGYQIGGPETFATAGDPNANRPIGDPKKTSNNPMTNGAAAAYVNNIIDSIDNFSGNPGGSTEDYFMPGEWLADTFLLPAGLEAQADPNAPCSFSLVVPRNLLLRQYMLDWNDMGFGGDCPPYGIPCAGLVPGRAAGTYTDYPGAPAPTDGRYFYKDSSGTVREVTAGKVLSERNRVMGDFDDNGQRNLADIPKLMEAVYKQLDFDITNHGGCYDYTGMVGDYLIVTVVGDFDGDGNFDSDDVRYFADGLAMQGGQLQRKQAFIDVDNAWNNPPVSQGNNYFGTQLATCKLYAPGDSRGDVAGSAVGPAPGAIPQGHDGVVDINDVEYVKANIGNWANLDEAVNMDLSANMDGNLTVNCDDVVEIVEVVLGTRMGDLDLDGMVNNADLTTLQGNLGLASGATYAQGDLDCDGDVDPDDEAILQGNLGFEMAPLEPDWYSVRFHGGSINQDYRVELDPVAANEPRSESRVGTPVTYENGLQEVWVQFDADVSGYYIAGQVLVSGGTLAVTGEALTDSNKRLEIYLSGSVNDMCYEIDVSNSFNFAGMGLGPCLNPDYLDCCVRAKVGDSSGGVGGVSDGLTNLIDANDVYNRNAVTPIPEADARFDNNTDGLINLIDYNQTYNLNSVVKPPCEWCP